MAVINGNGFANNLFGTIFDDTISGFGGNDTITGRDGNDEILGGSGNDQIDGGTGNDRLDGGTGSDTILGGADNDVFIQGNDGSLNVFDGGTGNDTLDLRTSVAGWDVDFSTGSASSGTSALTLSNIENLFGSNLNDTISSGSTSGFFYGFGGNDLLISNGTPGSLVRLFGGDDNDTLQASGTTSSDFLYGNSGINTYLFDDPSGTYVNTWLFGGGTDRILISGQANGDVFDLDGTELASIEEIEFAGIGGFRDITLRLDPDEFGAGEVSSTVLIDGNNALDSTEVIEIDLNGSASVTNLDLSGWTFQDWGGQGERVSVIGSSREETIIGTTQADSILGGEGNDTIVYNGGNDTIVGGAGNRDRFDASTATLDMVIDLTGATQSTHGTDLLFISEIETVFTGSGNDYQISNGTAGSVISLYGGSGNDTLEASGTAATDFLFGQSGTNTYRFTNPSGIYSNAFLFGGGTDRILITGQATGDVFDLSGVEYASIEEIEFDTIGTFRDITVQLNPNEIGGTELSDNVLVDGYNALDSTEVIEIDLNGSASVTNLDLSGWTFQDWGGQGERVSVIGSSREETIIGTTQADSILGGEGNDTIVYNGGNDTIVGGAGNRDRFDASTATLDMVIDLTGATQSTHGTDLLFISEIETVFTGSGNDYQISNGTAGSVISLYGGSGNDTLEASGTAATDFLFGQSGTNTYRFTNPSGIYSNAFLFGGGTDRILITGQATGDVFDLSGVEYASIEEIEFDTIGTFRDITVQLNPNEIGGTELSDNVLVDGYNALDSTEVIEIDLNGSASVTNLDLSGWTFQDWGGQGERVSVIGSSREETIIGTTQADSILGGEGNDTIVYNGGNDTIVGGAGNRDRFDASTATLDMVIDLTGATQSTHGTDLLFISEIETVFTGSGNDYQISNGTAGSVISLYGGSGNDTLEASGTAATDFLFGQSGTNTYRFTNPSGIYSNAFLFGGGTDRILITGQATGDVFDLSGVEYASIEEIEFDTIGTFRDITVQLNPNEIGGTELSDNVLVDGYNALDSTEVIEIDLNGSASVTNLDLSGWTFQDWGGQGERVSVIGSSREETIIGTTQADSILGGEGNDTIVYNGGNDTIVGGAGNRDRFDASTATLDMVIDLTGATQSTHGTDLLFISEIETVFTGSGNDYQISNGTAGSVISLYGGSGNDTLEASGTAATDFLFGQSGTNTYRFTNPSGIYSNAFLFGGGTDRILITGQATGDVFDLSGVEYASIEEIEFDTIGTFRDITVQLNPNEIGGTELSDNVLVDGYNALDSTEVIEIDLNGSASVTNLDLSGWTFQDWGGQGERVSVIGSNREETITGSVSDDLIEGGAGADSLIGGGGEDTLSYRGSAVAVNVGLSTGLGFGGDAEGDTISGFQVLEGSELGDQLGGTTGAEMIIGLGGGDFITGGAGSDTLVGGTGDDTYFFVQASHTIIENAGEGTDQVRTSLTSYTLGDNLENLSYLFSSDFYGEGNTLNNVIIGGNGADSLLGRDGDDRLDGRGGIDTMVGGSGNDTYVVGETSDGVVELALEGFDTIETDLSIYFLGSNIEGLLYTGTSNFRGFGNSLNNAMTGGVGADSLVSSDGRDTLDGGAGADEMFGGRGDDLYLVDNVNDLVVEAIGDGNDTVEASVSGYTLAANVEALIYTGALDFHGTGNALANEMTGSSGDDSLEGVEGNDTLDGLGGSDTLVGGVGDDSLKGGSEADLFVLNFGDGADVIGDFERGLDQIDLSSTGLSFFDLTITDAVGGALVVYDTSEAEGSVLLEGIAASSLQESDFTGLAFGLPFAEAGTLSVNHFVQTVTLDRTYVNPVVVAFIATENGGAAVNVRVSNISGNQLTLRVQEPDALDGFHAFETVNFLVVEAGRWMLPDGTMLEAGTLESNRLSQQGFEQVTFETEFDATPIVLSQVQTANDGAFVTTRQRDADADGVRLTMQEEEASNTGGTHGTETLGWIAIEAGSGSSGDVDWLAGSASGVTDVPATVALPAGTPNVVAGLASFAGSDPAWARGAGGTPTSFDVSSEEDRTANFETAHAPEVIDYFAFSDPGQLRGLPAVETVAETGTLSLNHFEQTVTLQQSYENPVVVAFIATENGGAAVNVRVSNISGTQLTLRVQEPDALDGFHAFETVNFLVVEAGRWMLPDGTMLEAGTLESNRLSQQGFEQVTFETEFDATPIVLSQVQTANDGAFVTTRQRDADADGVRLTMQEEEASNTGGTHGTETLGWIAIEAGSGSSGDVDWLAGSASGVTDVPATVALPAGTPNVVAGLASFAGSDPAWARGAGGTPTSFDVSSEEDRTANFETAHAPEVVDYFAFNTTGTIIAYDAEFFL